MGAALDFQRVSEVPTADDVGTLVSVIAADVTGDAVQDVVVLGTRKLYTVFREQGSDGRGFVVYTIGTMEDAESLPSAVAARFHSLGAPGFAVSDVALWCPGNGSLQLHVATAGSLPFQSPPEPIATVALLTGMCACDFGGVPLADIVVAETDVETGAAALSVFIAGPATDGSPRFTLHPIRYTPTLTVKQVQCGTDFDGNGRSDLLLWMSDDDHGVLVLLLISGASPAGVATPVTLYTTSSFDFTSLGVADLNGDGRVDVLAAASFVDTVLMLRNNGNNNFDVFAVSPSRAGVTPSVAVALAADVNGDGLADILPSSDMSTVSYVLLNNQLSCNIRPAGAPSVTPSPTPSQSASPSRSRSASRSVSLTPSRSRSPTASTTASRTRSASTSTTASASSTRSATASRSRSVTASVSRSVSLSASASSSTSRTPRASLSGSVSLSSSPSRASLSRSPSVTSSKSKTASKTRSPTITRSKSRTSTKTATRSKTPTPTPTKTKSKSKSKPGRPV
jgi:hypothetical protein